MRATLSRRAIAALAAAAAVLCSCYDDYVKDYDTTAAYFAYQYDLRTFVVGEGMRFDITVALSGAMNNTRDRKVEVVSRPELVTDDLGTFGDGTFFTAYDGMMGLAPAGVLSQGYVSSAVGANGLGYLMPLPSEMWKCTGLEAMKISKGRHTAVATVLADSLAIVNSPAAYQSRYALAFELTDADTDIIPKDRSFTVIAVRLENTFYGNWYHGGVSRVLESDGKQRSISVYPTTIPQSEDKLCVLSTLGANSVKTDKRGDGAGSITLVFNPDGSISLHGSDNIRPTGDGCRTNGAKLLQDRKIFLNYQYDNPDGSTTVVADTLSFRNRVRDGVNEWQDENPLHYE